MIRRSSIALLLAIALTAPLPALAQTGTGALVLPLSGASETFDSLANTGTSSTLPTGWYFHETGSNANTTYGASDGSDNNMPGNTYSLGATGSTDRALGMVQSGSLTSTIGVQIENGTGGVLSEVTLSYTGEQWRLGTADRSAPDRMDVQFSLDATSLIDGNATWQDAPALRFTAPITTGAIGALDGNLPAHRVAISGTLADLDLAPGARFWVRWRDFNAQGADDALAIDDVFVTASGDPPKDIPPTVASTVPSNGAQNVPLNTVLSITFSEPVQVTAPWYSFACGGTPITTSVAGGPTQFTLTPAADLPAASACLLTVFGSAVIDLDGTPDAMEGDVAIGFDTLDPATMPPPSIVSVQPADGATNVPIGSDVRVTFNESVTVAGNAFALSCDSTAVTASLSGSQANWVLTPANPLPYGADCVFAITGSGIVNAYGHALPSSPTYTFVVIEEGQTLPYYGSVNTSSPEQLRCSLHHTIRGHQAFPYSGDGTNTWTILETVQRDPNDASKIIDSYRNRSYARGSDRSGQGGPGPWYNREHTWPNSLGFPNQTDGQGRPNAPFTDVHMLHLTDEGHNSARGNRPLANCTTNCSELTTVGNNGVGGGSGSYPGNSNWVRSPNGAQGSFEVWNHRKGDIARAVLYMAIRYEGGAHPVTGQVEPDLELTDNRGQIGGSNPAYMGLLSDILAWHQADPPTEEEVIRNDIVQSFQGNRNPFVDHPEWATLALFTSSQPATCELGPSDLIFANGFEID